MHTIESICRILDGRMENFQDTEITGINSLVRSGHGEITFLQDPRFEKHIYSTRASAVVIPADFVPRKPLSVTLIRVADISKSLIQLLDLFRVCPDFEQGEKELIHIGKSVQLESGVVIGNFSHVSDSSSIGEGTRIGTQVYLGKNVRIGKGVTVYPGVKIYHGTTIGDHCIIHANAVIGSDGFGFNRNKNGNYHKVPQVGNVVIENDVEIGANTVIDRSTFGNTIIRRGVKLDNLVQVAHNVEIGENTVIAAQTGISGSVTLGRNCVVGGQSAFVPHIEVAEGSQFQGKSGVGRSIKEPGGKYYGYPAIGFNDYIRSYSVFKILPELEKRVRELERELQNRNNTE
jgi:UDP-3-O-[3-hydroxymyristoyl] glucosamine N-acyltransferase